MSSRSEIERQVERAMKRKVINWGIEATSMAFTVASAFATGFAIVLLMCVWGQYGDYSDGAGLLQNTTFCYRPNDRTYLGYENYGVKYYDVKSVEEYVFKMNRILKHNVYVYTSIVLLAAISFGAKKLNEHLRDLIDRYPYN
jgi:hypothetical protein